MNLTFYHGSRKNFPLGTILRPQTDGYVFDAEVREFESLVDLRRPAEKLSRFSSVFLSRNIDDIDGAGGYTDAVYSVRVLEPVEKSDLAWYSEAWCLFNDNGYSCTLDQEIINKLIDAYWSGVAYRIASRSNFEYRVKSAIVDRLVELNVELNELDQIEAPGLNNQSCMP